MELDQSSSSSQQSATGPYPEPDESSAHPRIQCLYIYFNIILSPTLIGYLQNIPHTSRLQLKS
jgi:hypothetical protein